MTEYCIIGARSTEQLTMEVNKMMNEGWLPFGPPIIDPGTNGLGKEYIQSLAKWAT